MPKLFTWNINGIRTIDVSNTLRNFDADIFCMQETKVNRDSLTTDVALIEGYTSYFAYSKKRVGYSGVATYCKADFTPYAAEEGFGSNCVGIDKLLAAAPEFTFADLNAEGRLLTTYHKVERDGKEYTLCIINVYCPRNHPERPDRMQFRMLFNRALDEHARVVLRQGFFVVIAGDINIAHRQIDHCDGLLDEFFDQNEARLWLSNMLVAKPEGDSHFVDLFRLFQPNQPNAFTCWNTAIRARETNYGTRIDYLLADNLFVDGGYVESCNIYPDTLGSDHCPVGAVLRCAGVPSKNVPTSCTKLMPEFAGTQVKLHNFLVKRALVESPIKSSKNASSAPKQKKLDMFLSSASVAVQRVTKQHQEAVCKDSAMMETIAFSQKRVDVDSVDVGSTTSMSKTTSAGAWKKLFTGPAALPLCKGHSEPCVLRTVRKQGLNHNRQFYSCARPQGKPDDPKANCGHFKWLKDAA